MSGKVPKKHARTVSVTKVGRRLTKRTQTKVSEDGLDYYSETLDHELSMNLQRIGAQAAAVLEADGMQAEPIEFALERVQWNQRKDDSHDDDSLVGLAAQSLWHLHQLRLIEESYGKPDNRALQSAYSLGRLSILMRDRVLTTQQTKAAAVQRVPGTIETLRGGKVTKEHLVLRAIAAAGADAGSPAVWTQLLGVLDQEGLGPMESGAKDARRIECEDNELVFTFGAVKTMVSRLKAASSKTAQRGRPKTK